MKVILAVLLALFPCFSYGQVLKEKRVYYLDCSYSMKEPNGIWEKVCDNLKQAIDNVTDESTELEVIPFAFDDKHHSSLSSFSVKASTDGKAILKRKIDNIVLSRKTKTFHSDPLIDFYTRRVNPNKVTYMFFMTDGQNEEKPNRFLGLLASWGKKYSSRNVYGFYVMLDKTAKSAEVENIVNKQEHLWKVETADVNINLIRLQPQVIFNARNDKYFDVPIYGNVKGKSFSAAFPSTSSYFIKRVSVHGNKIRCYVGYKGNMFKLPYSQKNVLTIKMIGGTKFDFFVSNKIIVKCESKPERSLKVSVQ